MAIVLPVGPGGLFGDSSLQGAPGLPPTDTTNGIDSGGGANNDNSPCSTGTLSDTSDTQSFSDTLNSTQKDNGSKQNAKNHKSPAAPSAVAIPLPFPYQSQQAAMGFGAPPGKGGDPAEAGPQQVDAAQAQVAAVEAGKTSDGDADGAIDGQETSSELHSLSTPTQSLAYADAAAAAIQQQTKQDAADSQGGSSDLPQQMSWSPVQSLSVAPPASATTADAKVAGAGMAERVDVVRQIASQVSASAPLPTSGQQTVTLNIHPDHWGEMTINLTMDEASGSGPSSTAGAISATIVAQSSAVRDALIGQSKDLQNALESAGIKLQKLDIITAATAAGTVAAGHSASQSGFNANSNGNSAGQQNQQSHSNTTSQDPSGQQGQRQQQSFESMFGGSGQNQQRGGWLPSIAPTEAVSQSQSFTPIGLVEATASSGSTQGLNVLA
jgi:hypothetical protein